MIHIYYGDGKGKTTAACGLAVRAAGSGMKVLFAQFFKSGKSSEIGVISSLTNVTVKIPSLYYGRYKTMSDEQKKMIEDRYSAFLDDIILNADNYDLIVLDEAVSVYGYGLFERTDLMDFLEKEGKKREIVLTGRAPAQELIDVADYATEMRKEKHPFDKGVAGRKGIEF